MPGIKSPYLENYITGPVVYREEITADDTEPPDLDELPVISFPQLGVGASRQETCRIGGGNSLYVMVRLHGPGMTITPLLWRIIRADPTDPAEEDVAYLVSPNLPANNLGQSSMLIGEDLPAGDYVITVTGTFNGNEVSIIEQHTE